MCCLFRASSYAERLRLRIAVIHGQKEVEHDDDAMDGRNSPPPIIEQEPEESTIYTLPMRRKRNDSSKPTIVLGGIKNFHHDYCVKFNTIITVL